jgi:hypothetical protein
VIGRAERENFAAREDFFAEHHELVLEGADTKVFEVRRSERSDAAAAAGAD